MTLSRLNDDFVFHQKVCKVCAGEGLGLCEIGLKILKMWYQVLLAGEEAVLEGK